MTGVLAVLDAAGTPLGGWVSAYVVLSVSGLAAAVLAGTALAAAVARVKARRLR